jgi:hypothetical protein
MRDLRLKRGFTLREPAAASSRHSVCCDRSASNVKSSELATVRFETGPGEQAQVDYGQLLVWIGAPSPEILSEPHLVGTGSHSRGF